MIFRRNVVSLAARFVTALIVLGAASGALRADAATTWALIVGGHTPDNSVYANGFFPREITIHTGDTIIWQFDGFHNVTFLGGGPQPPFVIQEGGKAYANPRVMFRVGGAAYDSTGLHNSGTPQGSVPFSYSLTFTRPGRYRYFCTIHAGMSGEVNVVQRSVNDTPAAALARGKTEQTASVAAGAAAYAGLHPVRNGSRVIITLTGSLADRYSLLRFPRDPAVIAVGTTVTWRMRDPYEIHTVTFTGGDKPPELYVAQPQKHGPPKLLLNPAVLTPTTATAYDGKAYANSGFLLPPGTPGNPRTSFSLTFTKPGRYQYWCLVHKDEKQQGFVIVR